MVTLVILGLLLLPVVLVGGAAALFWKKRRALVLKCSATGYLILVLLFFFGAGPYLAAWSLTRAGTRWGDRQSKETPADSRIAYEDIIFRTSDSLKLSGWFIPPASRNAIIIGIHGLFRNRVELLRRIVPLAQAGYGALLYDSRSHGASDKGLISLGFHERNDVLGAMLYVQRRYQDAVERPKLVLMGVSLGAMATLEAAAESKGYSAIILDSPFSSLRETTADHCWLYFKIPRYPIPSLFLFWLEHLAVFDAERVDSHKALQRIGPVPLLILASEGDTRMGMTTARSLYDQSRSRLKEVKIFGKDVSHGAAARVHPEEYTEAVQSFLAKALQEEAIANVDP